MIDQQINTPLTSSAGRLFDAIASLTGICDVTSRQSEAPILLEQTIPEGLFTPYPFSLSEEIISLRPMIEAILQDIDEGISAGIISARFHTTLAHLLTAKARLLLEQTGATKVIISGGCFQNKFLTTSLQSLFSNANISLYIPSRIPCNDSGIAIGQIFSKDIRHSPFVIRH
jgi:hydrogenase maturation protein HypF